MFIMLGVGVAIGTCGFIYWNLLLSFSHSVARKTKENYLQAILKQETGWFDSFNYNELASRMTKETLAINKAVGEKVGLIVFALGMTICGFVIGIVNGWSLALAMTAVGPVIGICAWCYSLMANKKSSEGLKAYA